MGKHRARQYGNPGPFDCEWVTVKLVKPRNNIDDVAKMAAVFVAFLTFVLILASIFVF